MTYVVGRMQLSLRELGSDFDLTQSWPLQISGGMNQCIGFFVSQVSKKVRNGIELQQKPGVSILSSATNKYIPFPLSAIHISKALFLWKDLKFWSQQSQSSFSISVLCSPLCPGPFVEKQKFSYCLMLTECSVIVSGRILPLLLPNEDPQLPPFLKDLRMVAMYITNPAQLCVLQVHTWIISCSTLFVCCLSSYSVWQWMPWRC